ncbi:hypothetical protein [Streptomyces sp. NPDC005799]|uniref:hypothetical protein n=1 Tax=Streptomyces sp. NPDC005799 TaxID=3154678 RepID=UPI0033E08325
MRWSLISLVAAALLTVALARTRSADSAPDAELIPLTRPELLNLLRAVVLSKPFGPRCWPSFPSEPGSGYGPGMAPRATATTTGR